MYMNIVCMHVQTFPHNITDKNKNKEPLGGRKTRYKYEYESAWFGEKRMLLEVSRGVQQGPNKRTSECIALQEKSELIGGRIVERCCV